MIMEFDFKIVGFKKNEKGEYTAMVTETGETLEFSQADGAPIPLRKDFVEKYIKEHGIGQE